MRMEDKEKATTPEDQSDWLAMDEDSSYYDDVEIEDDSPPDFDYYDAAAFEDDAYYSTIESASSTQEDTADNSFSDHDELSSCESTNPIEELTSADAVDPPAIPEFIEMLKKAIEVEIENSGGNVAELSDRDKADSLKFILYHLPETTRRSVSLYDQLEEVTCQCLMKYGFDEQSIRHCIRSFREEYYSQYSLDKGILDKIISISRDEKYKDKASVLPLMCGSGKSTAITCLIIRTIKRIEKYEQNKDSEADKDTPSPRYDGILIVTDSKERLKSLWAVKDNLDSHENDFITSHEKGWVTVMTDENSLEAKNNQHKTPILLVTTQRYFSWTREEIQEYLQWDKGRRSLIIFDEIPYLNGIYDVSIKTLNDIDTALWLGLDNFVKIEDKQWCIHEWENFREQFSKMLFNFEYEQIQSALGQENRFSMFFFEPKTRSITSDDERFDDIITKYKGDICKHYFQEYQAIEVVKKLMNTWGIYTFRNADTGDYENKIVVYIDNRDKLTNLGAKVIILDGTADISPIYDGQDYVHIHTEYRNEFLRSLSYLTIKLGDYDTSKSAFSDNKNKIAPHIKQYLQDDGNMLKEMCFFTYKRYKGKFGDSEHTAHFGDIKGKNEFNKVNTIAQVGYSSLQPSQYLAHVIARNDKLRDQLVGKTHRESGCLLEQIMRGDIYHEFRTKHILADIDQCMFRSAIRSPQNTEKITYYLFFKRSTNIQLVKEIYKRYRIFLKAKIIEVSNGKIDQAWKGPQNQARAKIWIWLEELKQKDEVEFKKEDILKDLHMNRSTFDSAVNRDKPAGLYEEFEAMKKAAQQRGLKRGYYAKVTQNDKL